LTVYVKAFLQRSALVASSFEVVGPCSQSSRVFSPWFSPPVDRSDQGNNLEETRSNQSNQDRGSGLKAIVRLPGLRKLADLQRWLWDGRRLRLASYPPSPGYIPFCRFLPTPSLNCCQSSLLSYAKYCTGLLIIAGVSASSRLGDTDSSKLQLLGNSLTLFCLYLSYCRPFPVARVVSHSLHRPVWSLLIRFDRARPFSRRLHRPCCRIDLLPAPSPDLSLYISATST
jgi:hypothetical protein